MSAFEAGERVMFNVAQPPNLSGPSWTIPPGTVGVVVSPRLVKSGDDEWYIYSVDYLDQNAIEFYEKDLQPLTPRPVMHPDMELEEIEQAEQIMEGLK